MIITFDIQRGLFSLSSFPLLTSPCLCHWNRHPRFLFLLPYIRTGPIETDGGSRTLYPPDTDTWRLPKKCGSNFTFTAIYSISLKHASRASLGLNVHKYQSLQLSAHSAARGRTFLVVNAEKFITFYKMLMNLDTKKRPHGGTYENYLSHRGPKMGGPQDDSGHQCVLFDLHKILNVSELLAFKMGIFHTKP